MNTIRTITNEPYRSEVENMDVNIQRANGTLLPTIDREELARKAVVLRKEEGKSLDTVAAEFGVGRQSLAVLCDVVVLADRDDLPAREAAIVQEALTAIRTGRRMDDIRALIEPICTRVWGASTKRGGGRERNEHRRREQFEQAIAVAVRACANASQLEQVLLSPMRADALCKELTLAIRQLHITRANLGGVK